MAVASAFAACVLVTALMVFAVDPPQLARRVPTIVTDRPVQAVVALSLAPRVGAAAAEHAPVSVRVSPAGHGTAADSAAKPRGTHSAAKENPAVTPHTQLEPGTSSALESAVHTEPSPSTEGKTESEHEVVRPPVRDEERNAAETHVEDKEHAPTSEPESAESVKSD